MSMHEITAFQYTGKLLLKICLGISRFEDKTENNLKGGNLTLRLLNLYLDTDCQVRINLQSGNIELGLH